MLRTLYADIRNAFLSKGIRIITIANLSYIAGYVILMKVMLYFIGGELNADDILPVYNEYAIFVITAASLVIYVNEFASGIIRNKLCSGAKRRDIYLASVISSAFIATFISAIAQIFEVILSLIFTKGLYNMTLAEVAFSFSETTISCVTIAIFSTTIIMVMGGTNASYVVGLGIAFVFKVFGIEVLDKLYPEYGKCTLTGTKLQVYTFFDRYVPYAHCSGTPRWDMMSCVEGCVVLVLISLVLGLIVFNKKELK